MIRAIAAERFKDFKPTSYEMIKNDYGIYDLTADEESELFGGLMDKEFDNLVPKDFQKGFKNLETSGKNSFLLELKEQQNLDTVKDLFCAELNEIKKEIKNIKKEEKESCRQNLLNLFKCVVCFESAPNSYMSCPFCGRYLGCYKCISELNRCPICRRKFQCNVCHCNFPKSPLFIPGIGECISLLEVRRQTIDKGNESDGTLCQASTIPAADNLPDLELPGPDETS